MGNGGKSSRAPSPSWLATVSLHLLLVLGEMKTFALPGVWQDDVPPRVFIPRLSPSEHGVLEFAGNETSVDKFKLILLVDKSLIVGARNVLYNLSLVDLKENQRLEWYSDSSDQTTCNIKGKTEDECQNYIRVLSKDGDNLFVCGTNAFKPMCRTYKPSATGYEMISESRGNIICPYDPNLNTTTIIEDGLVYAASYADFQGDDPLIFRNPLRTRQYDLMHFNSPNFVSSMALGDYIFFFFREMAVEYTNCGKAIFSRVGRVCKNDMGDGRSNRWTTFLKARLNCSIPGDFPFYFDEIQATSDFVEGDYSGDGTKDKVIYAAFSTPVNSLTSSAICAFSLRSILDAFQGAFKSQEGGSFWRPVKPQDHQPGQCHHHHQHSNSGQQGGGSSPSAPVPRSTADFLFTEKHPLMDESVGDVFGSPILVRTFLTSRHRFTDVAVDPQVMTVDGTPFDVVFVGTLNGWVIKVVNAAPVGQQRVESVVIEEIRVLENEEPVRTLRITPSPFTGKPAQLVVVGDSVVKALPLHRCSSPKLTSCTSCVGLQDPYCAWDKHARKCVHLGKHMTTESADGGRQKVKPGLAERYLQNVRTGKSPGCPAGEQSLMAPSIVYAGHDNYVDRGMVFTSAGDQSGSDGLQNQGSHKNGKNRNILIPAIVENGDGSYGNTPASSRLPAGSVPSSNLYAMETLAVTVTGAGVTALLLGFILGYILGRKVSPNGTCVKDARFDSAGPCVDAEYEFLEQRPSGGSAGTMGHHATLSRFTSANGDQGYYTGSVHHQPLHHHHHHLQGHHHHLLVSQHGTLPRGQQCPSSAAGWCTAGGGPSSGGTANLYATPFVYSSGGEGRPGSASKGLDASPVKGSGVGGGKQQAGLDAYYVHPAIGGGAVMPGTSGTLRKMYL